MTTVERAGTREDVRSSIIDAASRLLRDGGARAVTTRAVAQAAGVQAPTIYRLFNDKDGLIDAVAEQVMMAYVSEKVAAAQADSDPVADLRAAWHTHIRFGLENAELYVLLNTPGRSYPSPATAAGIEVLRTRIRRIAATGLLGVGEQRALDMVHAAGAGTVLALLNEPAPGRDSGLADAIFDIVATGILTTAPAKHDTSLGTVAVTFLALLPDLPALTDAERTLMAEWVARSVGRLQQP